MHLISTDKDMLDQVKNEFNQSKQVTMQKRYIFRNRLRLYNDQVKQQTKVDVKVIFQNIQALIAISMSDQLKVGFVEREIADMDQADMRTKLAKFDFEEMCMEEVEYWKLWRKFFTGVGIVRFVGWNSVSNTPIVKVVNTMSRIPDPFGNTKAENFRWMGFQEVETRDWMEKNSFKDIDKFSVIPDFEFYIFNPFNALPPTKEQSSQDVVNRYVYYHDTIFKGKKIQIATNYAQDTIGRIIEYEDKLDEEKGSMTKWDTTLAYYSPEPYNPYGTSLVDLLEDKQRHQSILLNLAIARAMRSSLGGIRIYNSKKITNRNDFANLTSEPKLIGVNLEMGESIQDVMKEVEFAQVPNDNINVSQELDAQIRVATGIDPQTIGVQGSGDITATQSEKIQANANLILGKTLKIDMRQQKDFRRKRMKQYKLNFRGKKIVRIMNELGTNSVEIKKDSIKTNTDPDIIITSSLQQEEKKQKIALAMQYLIPFLQQEGGFGYKFALRYYAEALGIEPDAAATMFLSSAEEEEARSQVQLLSSNIPLEPVTDLTEDHDAYIAIYKQAKDTPEKWNAIDNRRKAKIQKRKMENQQPQMPQQGQGSQGLVNAASNAMVNNAMQQPKQAATTQSVL